MPKRKSTRTHLTDNGPMPCYAETEATCKAKYNGEKSPHFDDVEAAQAEYEKRMGEKNGHKGLKKPSPNRITDFPMTQNTKEVMSALQKAGIRPLMVGGCVRDYFLGKVSKDVDFELYGTQPDGSSLDFDYIAKNLQDVPGLHIDEAGQSFAVLKVRKGKEDFDLAIPRTEQTTGMGHKDYDVAFDSRMDYSEAASRRDFTINSMAFDGEKVVDPYNGRKDLKNKTLRHISDAFSDDPLRCLRAVNFASRFDMKVAPETVQLCRDLAPHYDTLAKERVAEEFAKVFKKGEHCGQGMAVLHDIGWADRMPGFKECSREELQKYGNRMDKSPRSLRMAVMAASMTEDGKSSALSDVTNTIREQRICDSFTNLAKAGKTGTSGEQVAAHREMRSKYSEFSNHELKQAITALGHDASFMARLPENPAAPKVTGQLLIDRGMKPGKEMGAIIKSAQKIQDDNPDIDTETLLKQAGFNA